MLDLRAVNRDCFRKAKRLWALCLIVKTLIFLIGAHTFFIATPSKYVPLYLLLLSLTSEGFQWWSDVFKSRAESSLRRLDLCRSFQMEISAADKREIVSYAPRKLRKQLDPPGVTDDYFDSSEPLGPRRAIQNLVESAWYTQKQSGFMRYFCIGIIGLVIISAVVALIISFNEVGNAATKEAVIKLVTSWTPNPAVT